jgi:parallel beta-helix repeat protein
MFRNSLATGLFGFALSVAPLQAATLIVTSTADSGPGSLRAAITAAEAEDTIELLVAGTITLSTGQLNIARDVTIAGPGAAILTVSGDNAGRVFFIGAEAAVEISGVTIAAGRIASTETGAGIYNAGQLILNACAIKGNSVVFDGVRDANGGGVMNDFGATAEVNNCTFTGNSALYGSALYNNGTMTVVNSTVSGNTAVVFGNVLSWGTLALRSVTIAQNANYGLFANGVSTSYQNSIFAANTIANVGGIGGQLSLGGNISSDATGTLVGPGDLPSTDPLLLPLADNGGPTRTHALQFDSPAHDAVTANAPPADQRGVPRPQGRGADIGAFEMREFVVTHTADAESGSLRQAILDANSAPGPDRVAFDLETESEEGAITIRPLASLPVLEGPVLIDGFTQPGAAPNDSIAGLNSRLLIELDGSLAGDTVSGLILAGSGSVIRGLVVNRFHTDPPFANAQILISGLGGGHRVEGCYLGVDASGTVALSRGAAPAGIRIVRSDNNRIGGGTAAQRNLISGFARGVILETATGTQVLGNFIGTDASGSQPIPNGTGVWIDLAAGEDGGDRATFAHDPLRPVVDGNGNRIGGATPMEGNLIRFNNPDGVLLNTSENVVLGNTIADNARDGVRVFGGVNNRIQNNAFGGNLGLGINLGADGITPNDAADADTGPNNLLNFPEVSPVVLVANTMSLRYTVPGAAASVAFPLTVDFYKADASGRQGALLIHTDTYSAAEAGQLKAITVPRPPALLATDAIVATATDPSGNTSEFGFDSEQAGAGVNAAPALSAIASQTLIRNAVSPRLAFVVRDEDPGDLAGIELMATSSNPAVIPNTPVNIVLSGAGAERAIQVVAGTALGVADVTIRATDPLGAVTTATFTVTVVDGLCAENVAWVRACRIALAPNPVQGDVLEGAADQSLDQLDQSRWYKFAIQPGSRVVVTLTGLPANYDLVLYKDIRAKFEELTTLSDVQDLALLNAEFAPEAYSPEAYSPEAYSPEAYSPEAYSPEAYSPEAYSPEAYSPEAYSPEAYSPEAYSPEAYSPEAYSPEAYSPEAYSPEAYSPEAYSPEAYSPEAYSDAQTRSVLGVSAFAGLAGEGLIVNTWDNAGDFYVRVRGRNGAHQPGHPFHLAVRLFTGACGAVSPLTTPSTTTPRAGDFKTVVLADFARLEGSAAEKAALQTQLASFIARPEVKGVVIDVGADARVAAANAQADANKACVFAKNLVAEAIREIVLGYRALNSATLEHVLIIGHDDVIPFFRFADQALLASERNFFPPVRDNTHSQASLRLGHVLTQDKYGAICEVSLKAGDLPLPDLAVGRLVETAAEVSAMFEAYAGTVGGLAPVPNSSLVTGYDFLADAAAAVQAQLVDGIGVGAGLAHDALIAPSALSPQADPAATEIWTAQDLRELLLGRRYAVVFLAGHFSGSTLLASDFKTRMFASELAASPVAAANALIVSTGCHSGYNVVDPDGVENVTLQPDWAQACALKGINLVAGTGYQYGDTEFLEYSERLYLEFFKQLRAGTGPVAIGRALVAAKRAYLAGTPQMRGIHAKALLQASLFGFPMLQLDLPGARLDAPAEPSIVGQPGTPFVAYTTNPGLTLGLTRADVSVASSLTPHTKTLDDITADADVTATWFSGGQGTVVNPAEPVLPLEVRNVSAPDLALRGVSLRGGVYTETPGGLLPLTGAPATETRGVHGPFLTDVFYPIRIWNVNYFDLLCSGPEGSIRLALTPAQYRSDNPGSPTGAFRVYSSVEFRLFYSANVTTYRAGAADSTPALSDAPSLAGIRADSNPARTEVVFQARAHGNVAAGIQEVWVTYTAIRGPWFGRWQSLDLRQHSAANVGAAAEDSTLWTGTLALPPGVAPADVRFIAQAVNGVGLVSLATALGALYVPDQPEDLDPRPLPPAPSAVSFLAAPAAGRYGERVTLRAVLTDTANVALAGQRLLFSIGSQRREAVTDASGVATATLSLHGLPGNYELQVAFDGNTSAASTSSHTPFSILKQHTTLALESVPNAGCDDFRVTLRDAAGHALGQRRVVFVITDALPQVIHVAAELTDYAGRAELAPVPLPAGTFNVRAHFLGSIPTGPGTPNLELADDRYLESSTAEAALNLTPALVDVRYTGDTRLLEGERLQLAAHVTGPGDLTRALAVFAILDSGGAVLATIVSPVDADGIALAIADGLGVGGYQVVTCVQSGCYAATPVTTEITVGMTQIIGNMTTTVRRAGLPQVPRIQLLIRLNAARIWCSGGHVQNACNELRSFIVHVETLAGRRLSAEQASALIAEAEALRVLIGCR